MSKSNPATLDRALTHIRDLLDQNKPGDALELISKFGAQNPEMRNALGVCFMRIGEYTKALEVYRGLCLGQGVSLKPDAPVVHLVNYATALLLLHNVTGCLDIIRQVSAADHPGAARLHAAVDQWRSSLSLWQRLGLICGVEPSAKIDLDFPSGVLS